MLHYINSALKNTKHLIIAHSGGSFLTHHHFAFMYYVACLGRRLCLTPTLRSTFLKSLSVFISFFSRPQKIFVKRISERSVKMELLFEVSRYQNYMIISGDEFNSISQVSAILRKSFAVLNFRFLSFKRKEQYKKYPLVHIF